jgi:two-component system nitrate/nitrite response regulator NarL
MTDAAADMAPFHATASRGGPEKPLRVAIAAADPLRRRGLEAIVTGAGHRLVALPGEADVVLADGESDLQFELQSPGLPVVALAAAEAGQAGLLPRAATPAQIDAALRAVAAGLVVRPAPGFTFPSSRPAFRALADAPPPLLSPREAEILALIGDGLSNKEVARRLGISGHTVKFHIESLFRKLAAGSRAEAVRKGLRQGLIEL